jgi:hypothetical protein
MSDELQAIVDEIGALADLAEKDKWAVASAIAAAYSELPLYSRGLTSGLCLRLKKSEDMIYNLRDAENLRANLRYNSETLSVSHFSTLSHLQDKFNLTDSDCVRWLDWAKECSASVRELSCEVSTAHTIDQKKEYFRLVTRMSKLLDRLWEDAESVDMPENLRQLTKAALRVLMDWIDKLTEWKNGPE